MERSRKPCIICKRLYCFLRDKRFICGECKNNILDNEEKVIELIQEYVEDAPFHGSGKVRE